MNFSASARNARWWRASRVQPVRDRRRRAWSAKLVSVQPATLDPMATNSTAANEFAEAERRLVQLEAPEERRSAPPRSAMMRSWIYSRLTATYYGATSSTRIWLPLTPSTATTISSPIRIVSPTLRLRISIRVSNRRSRILARFRRASSVHGSARG